jgi:hypothetical protein
VGMSLKIQQRLEDAKLTEFYDGNDTPWKKLAKETHDFVKTHFPNGAKIRRDDVSEALVSYLEVDESLNGFLKQHKLRQKYWIEYFADLIIDRTWGEISKSTNGVSNA